MKLLKITLQGKTYEVGVEVIDSATPVVSPAPVQAAPAQALAKVSATPAPSSVAPAPAPVADVAGGHSVTSPMPGVVFKIGVSVGQQVAKDQELLVLEAMKMESPVYAPFASTVELILVKQGDAVLEGQALIQLS